MRTRPTAAEGSDRSNVAKLQPSSKLPPGGVLRGFTADEVGRLERILREPLECVVHPSFKLRSAEAQYGRPVAPEPVRAAPGDDFGEDVQARRKRSLPRGLTREKERELFLALNYARYRTMRLLRASRGVRLTREAARELLRWDEQTRAARDLVVQANLGLVPTMIERSRITGVDFSELISEGQLALLRAVSKFDCSRGFKFSTYACRAILSSISRSVALAARHRNLFPTEFDPELQRSDELERRREVMEENFVTELNEILARNLAELTTAEKRVLVERFGVPGEAGRTATARPKTLRQVAALFGVTKERVRQIQNKALSKLRHALEERLFAA
jgi:RNA polymerase primary sigma factor